MATSDRSGGKPGGFLAALFEGRSASEDDEEGAAPAVSEKSASASVVALAASAKSADPVPMPRAKPRFAATIQLAAADAQIVPAPKAAGAGRVGRRQVRTEAADAGRYHQCPRLLGRRAGRGKQASAWRRSPR